MKKLWLLIPVIIVLISGIFISNSSFSFKKNICIQPFGTINSKHIIEVKNALESYYECEVVILDPIDLPAGSFINIRSPRYRADSLIRYLRNIKPKDYKYIIGLTNKDISITKYSNRIKKIIKEPEWKYKDFGIFGLGFRPGSSCVVSTYRLYSGNVSEKQMLTRLRKIACHEIGHNMGLKHCPNQDCFMRDAAEKMSTIDHVPEHLCKNCLNKTKL